MTFNRSNVGTRDMSWTVLQLYAKKSHKLSDQSSLWINVPGYGAHALEAANERIREELILKRQARARAAAASLSASAVPRMFNATGPWIADPRKPNKVQASQGRQMVIVGQQVKARPVTQLLENTEGFQDLRKATMAMRKQRFMDRSMEVVTPVAKPITKAKDFSNLMNLVRGKED